ncbi:MAG TPA: T9SS type A sorting domain-containing protein [Flavobacteriia bacterium]|nr:T9SS type A sorting domain-containing protein [Flavobacteriia bacterium]
MYKFTVLFMLGVAGISFGQASFQESAVALRTDVTYGNSFLGGGVSFCDFDGDGWDDITYATGSGQEIYFFKNNQGTFSQINLGIANTFKVKQVIWIDYDNDGDKDFFATSIEGFNKFYRNDGNLSFTDITASIGFFTDDKRTFGASFGDIDNDGDLDAFICNRDDIAANQYSYLYRNDNGTYVDITAAAGLSTEAQLSFCSAFFDYNNDGFQDIYIANDKFSNINRLYKNNGDGTFTDVSVASGAGIAIDAMSTTIGDYNNDGWFDIYVSNSPGGNYHLRNNGDGTFTNVASTVGTAFFSVGWGAVFFDADNDTDVDLYVSSSEVGAVAGRLPSAFYENQGNNTFTIPAGIGFENDNRKSYSNAIGDINNDGLPDIIVMNDTENNFLWKNTSSNANHWLKIKLQGVASNSDGIGSKIEISAGGKVQYRYTLSGEGYLAQNSTTEFFGLKDAAVVDYVKVTWLSGIQDVLENVAVNQTLNLVEGENVLSTDTFQEAGIRIYPNPSNGIFNIEGPNAEEVKTLIIYDVFGKKIHTQSLNTDNTRINLARFSEGLYFFTIISDSKVYLKKVIYQKR